MIASKRSGPAFITHNGELTSPILSCQGCRHCSVHDGHYFYCAGQYAENQNPTNTVPFPWKGAGIQLHRGPYPTEGCPYKLVDSPQTELVKLKVMAELVYTESCNKDDVLRGALIAAKAIEEEHAAKLACLNGRLERLEHAYTEVHHDMITVSSIFNKYIPSKAT